MTTSRFYCCGDRHISKQNISFICQINRHTTQIVSGVTRQCILLCKSLESMKTMCYYDNWENASEF